MHRLIHGNCLEALADLAPDSIDACVTDPPYGLTFMGKEWDHGLPGEPFWREVGRVLKPGAHLLAFGGTRTFHRLTCAVEDAGFEIRDCLCWLYGSGFPKSFNVQTAIAKAHDPDWKTGDDYPPEATPWQGWGTALKPAWEPIIVARKPLSGTVAANVERYGTGAVNVEGCRVESAETVPGGGGWAAHKRESSEGWDRPYKDGATTTAPHDGRWPANVILDEEAAAMLDEEVGTLTSGANPTRRGSDKFRTAYGDFAGERECVAHRGVDSGGPSRFFYCAKAGRKERNAGLDGEWSLFRQDDGLPERAMHWSSGHQNPGSFQAEGTHKAARNHHPTVKPLALMRWLVRLVTQPGAVVLDPFMGSGSTGCAAALEGFDFVGMEREEEYVEIARRRIAHCSPQTRSSA